MTTDFISPDIHCGKCAGRVKDALGRQPGVHSIDVDPPTHKVTVEFDEAKISREQIRDVLAEAGYPPQH